MAKQFNYEMLSLARQLRKVSQDELSKSIPGLTQGVLSKIERGRIFPDDELVEKFAQVLHVSPSFLRDDSYRRAPPVSFHRKRRKLGVKEQESIDARSEIYRLNLKKLLGSIDLDFEAPPPPAVDPDQFGREIDKIADIVRQRWSVPRGPIKSLMALIEKSGVIVVSFDFGTPLIDGFAQHEGDGVPPVIFINSSMSVDRRRFSLAHELGHLVMHHSPHPDQEIQANLFASAFLMPKRDIEKDFENLSIQRFIDLKLYWGTSIQALIYKAWEMGKISDRMFKYYNIEVSKRGWRTKEPIDITGFDESPSTIREIVAAHISELQYDPADLADLCGLEFVEFAAMYPLPNTRPKLKLVQ